MINTHDRKILKRLYITFGNGFPYFERAHLGFQIEYSDNWTYMEVHSWEPDYWKISAGDGTTYKHTENIMTLTEKGIQWIMQD